MNCTEFDAEEIKRLGKRFKKLVFIESIKHKNFMVNALLMLYFIKIQSVIQTLIGGEE